MTTSKGSPSRPPAHGTARAAGKSAGGRRARFWEADLGNALKWTRCDWVHHEPNQQMPPFEAKSTTHGTGRGEEALERFHLPQGAQPFRPPVSPPCPPRSRGQKRGWDMSAGARLASHRELLLFATKDLCSVSLCSVQANGLICIHGREPLATRGRFRCRQLSLILTGLGYHISISEPRTTTRSPCHVVNLPNK